MKLLVFSDSHGTARPMARIARALSPELAAHLGDYASDAEALRRETPWIELHAVRGNCDYGSTLPDHELIELGEHRIFITHGHRYGVKYSLDALINTAGIAGADLALFGHTHRCFDMSFGSLRVVNPGSFGFGGSYALLESSGGVLTCRISVTSAPE